jgi:hypothetical protein
VNGGKKTSICVQKAARAVAAENEYLKKLLDAHGIQYDRERSATVHGESIAILMMQSYSKSITSRATCIAS